MKTGLYIVTPVILIIIVLGLFYVRRLPTEITVKTVNQTSETESASDSSFLTDFIVITETPIPTNTPKPTLTPTITPIKISSSELEELFTRFSRKESIDREHLKRIALCESGFNSNSKNGIYGGMFQFSAGSWISTRLRMNLNTNPDLRYVPEEAVKTAAFKIATEGINAWPLCSKK